jgi:hypothetical protein
MYDELRHSAAPCGRERLHLSVVGWPIDGADDAVEMGTSRSLSEGVFPNVEHVHGITDYAKRLVA